jgi:hypothetical protein
MRRRASSVCDSTFRSRVLNNLSESLTENVRGRNGQFFIQPPLYALIYEERFSASTTGG